MKQPIHILCFLALIAPSITHAAHTVVQVSGEDYTIHTGASGGQCVVTTLPDPQGIDVSCTAGTDASKVNSVEGCLSIEGAGFCAKGQFEGYTPSASSQLGCASGTSYNVTTGNDNGTCTTSGVGAEKSMTCDDTEGNVAKATCSGGCDNQAKSGTGDCCTVGDADCKPGK